MDWTARLGCWTVYTDFARPVSLTPRMYPSAYVAPLLVKTNNFLDYVIYQRKYIIDCMCADSSHVLGQTNGVALCEYIIIL